MTNNLVFKSNDKNKLKEELLKKPEPRKEFASEALMLCLDVSGSMAESTIEDKSKIDALKEAAIQLIELSQQSTIGIVTFSNEHKIIQDIKSYNKEKAIEYLQQIEADRKTYASRALRYCFQELENIDNKLRRIILMTDGELWDEKESLNIIKKIAENGIIIDTVLFRDKYNSGCEQFMQNVASIASGVFVEARSTNTLVKAFKQLEATNRKLLKAAP